MTLLLCRESPKDFDLLLVPDYRHWRQGLQVDSKERARIGRKSRNATRENCDPVLIANALSVRWWRPCKLRRADVDGHSGTSVQG